MKKRSLLYIIYSIKDIPTLCREEHIPDNLGIFISRMRDKTMMTRVVMDILIMLMLASKMFFENFLPLTRDGEG